MVFRKHAPDSTGPARHPAAQTLPLAGWPSPGAEDSVQEEVPDGSGPIPFPLPRRHARHAGADDFWPLPPTAGRQAWGRAGSQDVLDALQEAGHEHLNCNALLVAAKAVLQARGLCLSDDLLRGWVALERPPLFPQWPRLADFRDTTLAACRDDPTLLTQASRFRRLITEAATKWPDDVGSLLFLTYYESATIHYLHHGATGRAPTLSHVRKLMGQVAGNDIEKLRATIAPHQDAILDCVHAMAAEGFATSTNEINALLLGRRLRLGSRLLHQLPVLVEGLQGVANWYFPKGEAPRTLYRFKTNERVGTLFRGQAPIRGSSTASPYAVRAGAGLAQRLLQAHPGGCSTEKCLEMIARHDPKLSRSTRQSIVFDLRRRGLLVPIDDARLVVNPDVLCRAPSLRVRAYCPPRETWPPHETPRSLAYRTPAARHAKAAVRAEDSPPADEHAERAEDAPARRGRGDRSAALALQVFEVLRRLHDSDHLRGYTLLNPAGRCVFDVMQLYRYIRQEHPGMTESGVRDALKGVPPSRIDSALAGQQWLLERAEPQRLADTLRWLQRVWPMIAFAPQSQIAAWVNQCDRQHYCTAVILSDFLSAQPVDEKAAVDAIDAMIADGRIARFATCADTDASTGTTTATGHRRINNAALRQYLCFAGIGVSPLLLESLLARRPQACLVPDTSSIDPALMAKTLARHTSARRVMQRLGLSAGSALPAWARYIEAFEQLFCTDTAGARPRFYSGAAAMRIFVALEDELEAEAGAHVAAARASTSGAQPPVSTDMHHGIGSRATTRKRNALAPADDFNGSTDSIDDPTVRIADGPGDEPAAKRSRWSATTAPGWGHAAQPDQLHEIARFLPGSAQAQWYWPPQG